MKLKQQSSLQNNNGKINLATATGGNSITESCDGISSNHFSRVNSVHHGNISQEANTSLKCK